MVQFFQQQPQVGIAEILGTALGQGLGGGIQSGLESGLAHRLHGFEREKEFSGLTPFFKDLGLEEEEVEALRQSGLSPRETLQGLRLLQETQQGKNLLSEIQGQRGAPPPEASFAGLKPEHALRLADMAQRREKEETRKSEAERTHQFRQETARRKENLPHYEESRKKAEALKKEQISIKALEELNNRGKLPQGLGKVVINPKTGELRPYAQLAGIVSPDTQRFIKTVNDFTVKAKDTFGGRVTNFELQAFKSRLPGLLNSPEGRRQIIEQMKIITDLDRLYQDSLQKTFQEGGLGRIPYEDAVRVAEERIAPEQVKLMEKFQKISQPPAPSGERVKVRSPEGKIFTVPKSQLEAARTQGFEEE